jgi:tetratricopeptide (TPR) repeat protein
MAASDVNPESLLKNGKVDEVRRVLDAALEQNPNNAEAYNQLCRAYFQLEAWDTALKMAEKSVSLAPENSNYHLWVGRAAGRKAENSNPFSAYGLARKVRAEFERAVALDSKNIAARADLAEYYLEAPGFLGGDKNKARQQADAISESDPALAAHIYALLEEKQGNKHAEQQFKKALEISGNQARYWVELAYFYKRSGRMEDMEAAIGQALSAPRGGSIPEYDGAFLFLRTGRNFGGAISMLRRYLASDAQGEDGPEFRAHYMLGQLLEKQGDRKTAAEEYRAALALAAQYHPAKDALARVSR